MKLAPWASVLAYPDENYHARVRACVDASPAPEMEDFLRTIEGLPVEALQELYTQTFDWSADTSLDIGWHLFGENYDRGEFLANLRSAYWTFQIAETHELPDHLSHVLQLLDHLPEDQFADFAANYAIPSLIKLYDGLAKTESPFLPVIATLRREIGLMLPETVSSSGENHE